MCRLYGFMATDPTRLECSLVAAQNALQVQSDRDARGRRNADGWGIARWSEGGFEVVQSTKPAFADRRFAEEARETVSPTVIAHVRGATVGNIDMVNTHPFAHGPWVFAHNGTLTTHGTLAPALLHDVHATPAGSTDSELIFQWLLGRMAESGLDPHRPAYDVAPVARLVEQAVLDLVRASLVDPTEAPPKLNFLLSDGINLVASRWGNSLYWTLRSGIRDCAICGTIHCPEADDTYRAVVVASEPLTDEVWVEVQEGTIVAVDRYTNLTTRDLLTRAA